MKTFRKNSTVLDQTYIYQCGHGFRFESKVLHPEHNGVFCFDSHFDQATQYPQIKVVDLFIFAKVPASGK